MARKKVTMDNFAEAIEEILDDYAKEVELTAKDVTQTVAKKGVNLLRAQSKSIVVNGTGHYARGWAPDYHTKENPFYVTLHNKSRPGLTHLLEKSHPVNNGGHYKGRPHIKKVEELVNSTLETELKSRL